MIAMKKTDKKATFIMMVGLPASGKSTIANILHSKRGYLHLSSDEIRKELLGSEESQEDNELVFDTMRRRTLEALKNGQDVVYDATNVNSKRRKGFLKQLPKNINKECIYMATNYMECQNRNRLRDRMIPFAVILKMFRAMQIPMEHEGWDKISIHREVDKYKLKLPRDARDISFNYYERFLKNNHELRGNVDLAQDSSYHSLSVHRHMYASYEEGLKIGAGDFILLACLLHDTGKYWTKSFKENSRYANFYGHENVSAQLTIIEMIDLGYSESMALSMGALVQLHTRIMQLSNQEKSVVLLRKFKEEIGNELYDKLEVLHKCDKNGK